MGDISTWNPVDNSNTTAPPDGWPEGMAPSAVNNCARAMMGAIRRWYDTVTTQLASLTTSVGTIANYLPLTGGMISGNLAVNGSGGLSLGPTQLRNISNGLDVTNASGGAVYSHGPGAGYVFGDHNQSSPNWAWSANNDVATLFYGASAELTLTGSGDLTSSGYVSANGYLVRAGSSGASSGNHFNVEWRSGSQAHLWIDNVDQGTIAFIVGGTLTAPNFAGNVSVPANGPVSTGGTVTGGQVTSTGNASVAGTLTAGSVSASSDVTAAGSVTGGSMHCMGTMQTDGQSNLVGPVFIGPSGGWARIDSGGTYNITGAWQVFSGRDVKENVIRYVGRGLDTVLALHPVSFTYRVDLFGAEEAEKTRYGLVADEVAPVLPEMVGEATFGGRDLPTVNAGLLPLVLINACKELAAQNAALAARITALEGHT